MQSKTLRESFQPAIDGLTQAVDYWNEQHFQGQTEYTHYLYAAKALEDIKLYVLEHERYEHEKLRISSRSDGGLHKGSHDILEDSGVENFGYYGA